MEGTEGMEGWRDGGDRGDGGMEGMEGWRGWRGRRHGGMDGWMDEILLGVLVLTMLLPTLSGRSFCSINRLHRVDVYIRRSYKNSIVL